MITGSASNPISGIRVFLADGLHYLTGQFVVLLGVVLGHSHFPVAAAHPTRFQAVLLPDIRQPRMPQLVRKPDGDSGLLAGPANRAPVTGHRG